MYSGGSVAENLEATIDISAPPERVWAVVSDLERMPEFSPQCVRMVALGAPKAGTWTINLNRDGKKYWPTTARIVRYEPNQAFAFRINENRSIWSYTLEPTETGTRLIERRTCPTAPPGSPAGRSTRRSVASIRSRRRWCAA